MKKYILILMLLSLITFGAFSTTFADELKEAIGMEVKLELNFGQTYAFSGTLHSVTDEYVVIIQQGKKDNLKMVAKIENISAFFIFDYVEKKK